MRFSQQNNSVITHIASRIATVPCFLQLFYPQCQRRLNIRELCGQNVIPCLEVIKLEFIRRLKIKRNDWLLFILILKLYSSLITSRPGL